MSPRVPVLGLERWPPRRTTEKERVLNDPGTRRLLVEANLLDIELYEFVRDELFPQWEGLIREAKQQAQECQHVPRAYKAALNRAYSRSVYRAMTALRKESREATTTACGATAEPPVAQKMS